MPLPMPSSSQDNLCFRWGQAECPSSSTFAKRQLSRRGDITLASTRPFHLGKCMYELADQVSDSPVLLLVLESVLGSLLTTTSQACEETGQHQDTAAPGNEATRQPGNNPHLPAPRQIYRSCNFPFHRPPERRNGRAGGTSALQNAERLRCHAHSTRSRVRFPLGAKPKSFRSRPPSSPRVEEAAW